MSEPDSERVDYYLIYKRFETVEHSRRAAIDERFEAAWALAEAVAMAKDAEHKAAVRRSIITASPPGRNADERSAATTQLLESDAEYKSIESEAREHRARAADVQRRIDVLDDEIKGGLEHMRILANLVSLSND